MLTAEQVIQVLKQAVQNYEKELSHADNLSISQLDAKLKEINDMKAHLLALDFAENVFENIRNSKKETPTFRK